MELLWINVFLDIAAVVALATDNPIDQLMQEKPYNISDRIITNKLAFEILMLSFY